MMGGRRTRCTTKPSRTAWAKQEGKLYKVLEELIKKQVDEVV